MWCITCWYHGLNLWYKTWYNIYDILWYMNNIFKKIVTAGVIIHLTVRLCVRHCHESVSWTQDFSVNSSRSSSQLSHTSYPTRSDWERRCRIVSSVDVIVCLLQVARSRRRKPVDQRGETDGRRTVSVCRPEHSRLQGDSPRSPDCPW